MFVHTRSSIQNPRPMSFRHIPCLSALVFSLLLQLPPAAAGTLHTLSVLVVDEQQNPIEGGVLFIDGDPGTEAVTGPGGEASYQLAEGDYVLYAYAPGYLDRVVPVSMDNESIQLGVVMRPALFWSTAPANAPVGVGEANGVRLAAAGGKVYLRAAYGGPAGTTQYGALHDFYVYDPEHDEWTRLPDAPYAGLYGISTAHGPLPGGGDAIYIIRGFAAGQRTWMARYNIEGGAWESGLNHHIPWREDLGSQYSGDGFQDYPRNGAVMVWDGNDHIYLFPGSGYGYAKYDWYRYSVVNDSWEAMDALPHRQGPGNAAVLVRADEAGLGQDYLYVQFGLSPAGSYTAAEFWRYGLGTGIWENMADHAYGADDGSMLAWDGGNYIYHTPGAYVEQLWDRGPEQKREIMRYCIAGNAWSEMEKAPYNRWGGWDDAGGIVRVGNTLYGLKGGSDVAWAGDGTISGGGDIPSDKFWKFSLHEHTVNLSMEAAIGNGRTYPPKGTHTYLQGSEAGLLAVAGDEWRFEEWTLDGGHFSQEPSITLEAGYDMKVQAVFVPAEFLLHASPSALSGLSYMLGMGPSASRHFSVMGGGLQPLSGEVVIGGSAYFELSANDEDFFPSIQLPYQHGTLGNTRVYVRLKAGLETGNYASEQVFVRAGEDSVAVVLSGQVNSISLPYAQNFEGFDDAQSLPFGWSVSDPIYLGDWGSGVSAGLRGNAGVLGYQHTATTGVFTASVELQNTGDEPLEQLFVSYRGMVARTGGGRSPEWTVKVDGHEVEELFYSTAGDTNKTLSVLMQLPRPIDAGEVFGISWSSDRGQGDRYSKQIGIAEVVVTATPGIPHVASLQIVGDVVLEGSLDVEDLSVGEGHFLTLGPTGRLNVEGELLAGDRGGKDGVRLLLCSGIEGTASLLHRTPGVMGSMERFLPGQAGARHMISSPVGELIIGDSDFEPGEEDTFSLWYESLPGNWIKYGQDEDNGGLPSFSHANDGSDSFFPGRGYLVSYQTDDPLKRFTGPLHTGSIHISLDKSSEKSWRDEAGWNLIGNPYPSSIDWGLAGKEGLADDFAYIYDEGTGNFLLAEAGHIPAHQGFFVKVEESATFTFTDGIRIHPSGEEARLDTQKALQLGLCDGNYRSTTLIRIAEGASFARDRRDALKLFSFAPHMPQLFSHTLDGEKVAVNSVPHAEEAMFFELGMRIGSGGEHEVGVYETKGPFTDIPVFFEDMQTDSVHELHPGQAYRFHAEAGTHTGRFRLHLHHAGDPTHATGPEAESPVGLWVHNATLYVDSQKEDLELRVYDVHGRLRLRFHSGRGQQAFDLGLPPGVYVVRPGREQPLKVIVH